jgi:hypothetical protein
VFSKSESADFREVRGLGRPKSSGFYIILDNYCHQSLEPKALSVESDLF